MSPRWRFALCGLLLLATWLLLRSADSRTVATARPLAQFPAICHEWRMTSQEQFDGEVLKLLRPTDYLSRHYESMDGRRVSLYVGYHDGGSDSGEIHSPRHCLPGTGWQKLTVAPSLIHTSEGDIHAVRAVYQKGGAQELLYYWFQVRGRTLDSEYALKLAAVTGALLQGRRDAGFVKVSMPFEGDEQGADAAVLGFVRRIYPELCRFLPGGVAARTPAQGVSRWTKREQ